MRPWSVARAGVTQPIAHPVPSNDAFFLADKGAFKVGLRVVQRRLELAASGQRPLLRDDIDPAWRRAVWFHAEAPQIGDALMDLAPRSLFAEHGIAIDLLAPPSTAALFAGDRGFGRVFADETDVPATGYDFAIVDSHAGSALAAKRRRAPQLPWLSVRGDYLAYDFQRGLLAARRFAEWLGVHLDAAAETRHGRQKLMPSDEPPPRSRRHGTLDVAVALGGVRDERTYRAWPAVAALLQAETGCRFTLLGSGNARAAADAFVTTMADAVDLVDRTSLHEARRAMQQADLLLCADGGLMHLGLTTPVPLVALFDATIDPAWRLPADFDGTALRADGDDVNLVAPARVAQAALRVLGRPPRAR